MVRRDWPNAAFDHRICRLRLPMGTLMAIVRNSCDRPQGKLIGPAVDRHLALVAGSQVGSCDYRLDLIQRHVKGPEPAGDLRRYDLFSGAAAVPGARSTPAGLEWADAVATALGLAPPAGGGLILDSGGSSDPHLVETRWTITLVRRKKEPT
jgi:hypothetical protein